MAKKKCKYGRRKDGKCKKTAGRRRRHRGLSTGAKAAIGVGALAAGAGVLFAATRK